MNEIKNENILFLTGKLAQKRLARILKEMEPVKFTYEIRNIGVSVAALMTAQMIARRITDLDNIDRLIVPGLCRGDLSKLSDEIGVPCIRGTIDMKDLPAFFGRDCKPIDLSKHDVVIFAEIVDAPMISVEEILVRAESLRLDGADIIDIGCLPDTPFPHLEDTVRELQQAGFKVSIDSLEEYSPENRAGTAKTAMKEHAITPVKRMSELNWVVSVTMPILVSVSLALAKAGVAACLNLFVTTKPIPITNHPML